jgi:hypothetical protein
MTFERSPAVRTRILAIVLLVALCGGIAATILLATTPAPH